MDLQNESVRISAEGQGVTKILDVKVEQKYTTEIQQENIKELKNRIDSLKQLSQAAFDEASIYQSKKEFVESLKAQSSKYMNEKMLLNIGSTKDWDKMLN